MYKYTLLKQLPKTFYPFFEDAFSGNKKFVLKVVYLELSAPCCG